MCNIQLSGALTTNEVNVCVRWLKDGSEYRVSIPNGPGSTLQRMLPLCPLLSYDSGRYSCEVTLTANQRSSPVMKTSPQLTLTVRSEH